MGGKSKSEGDNSVSKPLQGFKCVSQKKKSEEKKTKTKSASGSSGSTNRLLASVYFLEWQVSSLTIQKNGENFQRKSLQSYTKQLSTLYLEPLLEKCTNKQVKRDDSKSFSKSLRVILLKLL